MAAPKTKFQSKYFCPHAEAVRVEQPVPSTACSINSLFHQQPAPSTACSINSLLHQQPVPSTACSINSLLHQQPVPSTACPINMAALTRALRSEAIRRIRFSCYICTFVSFRFGSLLVALFCFVSFPSGSILA